MVALAMLHTDMWLFMPFRSHVFQTLNRGQRLDMMSMMMSAISGIDINDVLKVMS